MGIYSQTLPASPTGQRNHQHNNSAAKACPALSPPFLKYLFFIGAAYLSPLRDAFVIRFISLDPPSCSPRSIPSAATYIIIFLPRQKCHQKSCKNPGLCQSSVELCVPSHSPTSICQVLMEPNEISALCAEPGTQPAREKKIKDREEKKKKGLCVFFPALPNGTRLSLQNESSQNSSVGVWMWH